MRVGKLGGLRCSELFWPTRGDVRPMKERTYQNPLSDEVVTTQQNSTVAQATEGTNFPPKGSFRSRSYDLRQRILGPTPAQTRRQRGWVVIRPERIRNVLLPEWAGAIQDGVLAGAWTQQVRFNVGGPNAARRNKQVYPESNQILRT